MVWELGRASVACISYPVYIRQLLPKLPTSGSYPIFSTAAVCQNGSLDFADLQRNTEDALSSASSSASLSVLINCLQLPLPLGSQQEAAALRNFTGRANVSESGNRSMRGKDLLPPRLLKGSALGIRATAPNIGE